MWEAKRVTFYPVNGEGLPGSPRTLVVARHVLTRDELKYFLADAPGGLAKTPMEWLLWVALTRHRVERLFQDDKTELGLDHFEGRKYQGLMRHLMVTLVSHLFLMRATLTLRGKKSKEDVSSSAGTANPRQVA